MPEEQLARMEDMLGQLMGMIGKVLSEQQGMKADIVSINSRMDRMEEYNERFHETTTYLLDKTAAQGV